MPGARILGENLLDFCVGEVSGGVCNGGFCGFGLLFRALVGDSWTCAAGSGHFERSMVAGDADEGFRSWCTEIGHQS
jgi:hypothetical protein